MGDAITFPRGRKDSSKTALSDATAALAQQATETPQEQVVPRYLQAIKEGSHREVMTAEPAMA